MSAAAGPRSGVCLVRRKVESSIPQRVKLFHPTYMEGRAIKGTWGNLGRQKGKEMISIKMNLYWSQLLTLN
jgi:hypothetical protein